MRRIGGAAWRLGRMAAAAALILAGTAAARACTVSEVASLPLRLQDRHLVTVLTVGDRTVDALVDTGSAVSALDRSAASGLGLTLAPGRRAAITGLAGPSRATLDVVSVPGLALGGLQLGAVPLLRGDFNRGRPGAPLAAILGGDILGRYDLDVDLPAGRLRLLSVLGCEGRFVPWALSAVPLTRLAGGPLQLVPVALDGVELKALVDTGATESVLFAPGVARLGRAFRPSRADPRGFGIGAEGGRRVPVVLHRFGALRLGAEEIVGPSLAVARGRPMALDMILGLDVLARRRFWLSAATGQLLLGPER